MEVNTTVQEIIDKQPRVKVVTPDNFNAYVNERLGIDPEADAKKALEAVETEKAERKDEGEVDLAEVPEKKKSKINERFKELTDKRKEAEKLAEERALEAKEAKEERDRLKAEKEALLAKYETPKEDLGPEPELKDFANVEEYSKALKDWTIETAKREERAKQIQAQEEKRTQEIQKQWSKNLTEARKDIPDYDEVLNTSEVKVSDQVRDAILESDVGPKILHHLAKNPDLADKIGEMTVGGALRAIGRLEAELSGKPQPKTTLAEISKAPAPISPLKGENAPVGSLKGTDDVPKNWNYEDWKKARQAGKIK